MASPNDPPPDITRETDEVWELKKLHDLTEKLFANTQFRHRAIVVEGEPNPGEEKRKLEVWNKWKQKGKAEWERLKEKNKVEKDEETDIWTQAEACYNKEYPAVPEWLRSGSENGTPQTKETIKKTIAKIILSELARIDFIRKTMDAKRDKSLIEDIEDSLLNWRRWRTWANTSDVALEEKVGRASGSTDDEAPVSSGGTLERLGRKLQWWQAKTNDFVEARQIREIWRKYCSVEQLSEHLEAWEQWKRWLEDLNDDDDKRTKINSDERTKIDRVKVEAEADHDAFREALWSLTENPGTFKEHTLKKPTSAKYKIKEDVNVQVIKLKLREAQTGDNAARGLMCPKEGSDDSSPKDVYWGWFPNQTIKLQAMLEGEFCQTKGREDIRYFHSGYNNMFWVEKAISRYFKENGQDKKPQTNLVLRPEYWQGQLYGTDDTSFLQFRHLRPLCEKFATNTVKPYAKESQNNMVLFMPYLHWDTDRYRLKMVDVIDDTADRKARGKMDSHDEDRKTRKKERQTAEKRTVKATVVNIEKEKVMLPPWKDGDVLPRKIEDIFWFLFRRDRYRLQEVENSEKHLTQKKTLLKERRTQRESYIITTPKIEDSKRLRPKHPLAQFLIDAARLYETLATFQHQKVLEEFLVHDSPVHPRRTLDQAYFWKLKSTRHRDRDQVVYRYTQPKFEHTFRYLNENEMEERKRERREEERRYNKTWEEQTYGQRRSNKKPIEGGVDFSYVAKCEWIGHDHLINKEVDKWSKKYSMISPRYDSCKHCEEESRKVARVVMVDQLWMWILDENTILTCFPRRYGIWIGRKDPSGVHNSIRNSLADSSNASNLIRSVFDLALIILKECFNTFLDETKTDDRRPQVLDIFRESIGTVSNKQIRYFRHVWDLSERLTKQYNSKIGGNLSSRDFLPLLDLQPENELQREIRDIVNELEIIKYITVQQREIIGSFIKKAREILLLSERASKRKKTKGVKFKIVEISGGTIKLEGKQEEEEEEEEEETIKTEREIFQYRVESFDQKADALLSDVQSQIKELEGLIDSAKSCATSVDDLINLKQQQASVVQAYQATKQGEETMKQGRAIMIFTVMTIIFLPLSFMSSLFGMNAIELGNTVSNPFNSQATPTFTPWYPFGIQPKLYHAFPITFGGQLVTMFFFSSVFIVLVVLLAFNTLTQTILSIIWYCLRYLLSKLGYRFMYTFWLRVWRYVWQRCRNWLPIGDPSIKDVDARIQMAFKIRSEKRESEVRGAEYRQRYRDSTDEEWRKEDDWRRERDRQEAQKRKKEQV